MNFVISTGKRMPEPNTVNQTLEASPRIERLLQKTGKARQLQLVNSDAQ